MKRFLVTLLLTATLLIGCQTIPDPDHSPDNPRFVVTNMENPISGIYIMTYTDKDTGKEYMLVVIGGAGVSVQPTR